MDKICIKCNKPKKVGDFSFKNKAKNKRSNTCRACHKIYVKQHYQENKDAYKNRAKVFTAETRITNKDKIIKYLVDHPCVDCGENDIIVLEFDHVRGEKIMPVSSMTHQGGYSWPTIKKEIDKCEVRCANCHRRKTARKYQYYRVTFSI